MSSLAVQPVNSLLSSAVRGSSEATNPQAPISHISASVPRIHTTFPLISSNNPLVSTNIIPVRHIDQTGAVICKIEHILESVLDGILKGSEQLSIPFRSRQFRPAHRDQMSLDECDDEQSPIGNYLEEANSGVLSFPGKNNIEAKRFTAVIAILKLSHEALVTGNVISKRNVYYQRRDLFRAQSIADKLIDDLAYTLGFGRDALNIVADGNGIVSGDLRLGMLDDSVTSCDSMNENGRMLTPMLGVFIPPLRRIRHVDIGSSQWILVVEKEATFRTLAASQYWRTSTAGPGMMITAKGYPDLVTRLFLNFIHSARPLVPLYAVVDFDPDGIRILRTYKYSSQSLRHEANAAVPTIRWLGVRSGDLLDFSSKSGSKDTEDLESAHRPGNLRHGHAYHFHEQVEPLTSRDRRIGVKTLEAILGRDDRDVDDMAQARELQVMLMLNVKAEIQAVDTYGDLTQWLDGKLDK